LPEGRGSKGGYCQHY